MSSIHGGTSSLHTENLIFEGKVAIWKNCLGKEQVALHSLGMVLKTQKETRP